MGAGARKRSSGASTWCLGAEPGLADSPAFRVIYAPAQGERMRGVNVDRARAQTLVWRGAVMCGCALVIGCGSDEGSAATVQGGLEITLSDGVVVGEVDGATRRFLGIPFAAPPTGERRWLAPEPPEPWDTPLDAPEFSAACPQLGSTTSPGASENEDCLYLNVWAPEPAPSASRPVMIWFHGG